MITHSNDANAKWNFAATINAYILNDHNHKKTETSDTEKHIISNLNMQEYQNF